MNPCWEATTPYGVVASAIFELAVEAAGGKIRVLIPGISHPNIDESFNRFVNATGTRTVMRAVLLILSCLILPSTGVAQAGEQQLADRSGPLRGLVWSEPDDLQHAVRELTFFAESGVEAVRVESLKDTLLYAVGDSLGIQFFQELPYYNLPARVLVDSLDGAVLLLDQVLRASARHPSARHFGLSHSSDNSAREACDFYESLSARARQLIPEAKTYYVSHFFEDDACGLSVEFVLLDRYATDRIALSKDPTRYDAGRVRGYGVAELGRRIDEREEVGLNRPYSAESQARYLESSLPILMQQQSLHGSLVAVFVYRWGESEGADLTSGSDYSLTLGNGEHRPSWDVVEGVYSGTQHVFAFPGGSNADGEMPWLGLFGLIVASVIATSFAASPQFRQLVPRYFLSHGFYREAAAQGRDVTPVINGVLLSAVSLSVGIIVAVTFFSVRYLHIVQVLLFWMPDSISRTLLTLGDRPWIFALIAACGVALSTIIWISIMSVGSRLGRSLVPAQTLMVALWPQWLVLVLLPIALVLPSYSRPTSLVLVQILGLAAVVVYLWIMVRVLRDYRATSRAPMWVVVLVALANPVMLVSGFLVLFLLPRLPYVAYVYHLITRS